jgi:hypothetical protein
LSRYLAPDAAPGSPFDIAGFNSAKTRIDDADDDKLMALANEFISLGNPLARQMRLASDEEALQRSREGRHQSHASELKKLARYEEFLANYFGNGRIALSHKYSAHFGCSPRETSATVFYDGEFCHYVDRLGRTRSVPIRLPAVDESDLSLVEERFAKVVKGQAEAYNTRKILRRGEKLDAAETVEGKIDRGLFDTSFGSPWQFYASISPGQVFNDKALAQDGEIVVTFRSLNSFLKAMPVTTLNIKKFDRLVLIQVIGTKTVQQKGEIPPVSWKVRITRPICLMSGPYSINEVSVEGPLAIRDPKPLRRVRQLRLFKYEAPEKDKPYRKKKRKTKPIVTEGKPAKPATKES